MSWSRFQSPAKYGNTRSTCLLKHSHRSKLESATCDLYYARQLKGEISTIEVEKHVRVCGAPGHECKHSEKVETVVDFRMTRPDGSVFYGEAKGSETEQYRIKYRLWKHNNVGELEIWKGDWKRPKLVETIVPQTKERE